MHFKLDFFFFNFKKKVNIHVFAHGGPPAPKVSNTVAHHIPSSIMEAHQLELVDDYFERREHEKMDEQLRGLSELLTPETVYLYGSLPVSLASRKVVFPKNISTSWNATTLSRSSPTSGTGCWLGQRRVINLSGLQVRSRLNPVIADLMFHL